MQKLKSIVQTGFDDDKADYEIKDESVGEFAEFKDWTGFKSNLGKHVSKMYLEIEKL